MSQRTLVDWKHFLRDICAPHLIDNPIQLGGLGEWLRLMKVFSQEGSITLAEWLGNNGCLVVLAPPHSKRFCFR